MAEVYPSDSVLNALLSDADTGVEYIPTGTAPYYLHFRKLLYRLLLATRRANDLRVYDAGGLQIGVKPGKFWIGNTAVAFAGSSGSTLADDKANIYVYLDSTGTLVLNEYSAFPGMDSAKHVRLAVVTTSNGDITNITDARDYHSIFVPPSTMATLSVENHTADDQLTEAESGSVHTNVGASAAVTLTLPAGASAGTNFKFCVQAAQQLRIDPGAAAILDDSMSSSGTYIYADTVGECLQLVANSSGDWMTIAKSGFWSEGT